jgi:hypothetical protein
MDRETTVLAVSGQVPWYPTQAETGLEWDTTAVRSG